VLLGLLLLPLGLELEPGSSPHAAMLRTIADASAPARTLLATFFFIFYLRYKN
jgi:hypothetical protein